MWYFVLIVVALAFMATFAPGANLLQIIVWTAIILAVGLYVSSRI